MADGRIKVRVAAPAEGGKANRELILFLTRELGLPRSAVRIVAGLSARDKVIEVRGTSARLASWLTGAPERATGDRRER